MAGAFTIPPTMANLGRCTIRLATLAIGLRFLPTRQGGICLLENLAGWIPLVSTSLEAASMSRATLEIAGASSWLATSGTTRSLARRMALESRLQMAREGYTCRPTGATRGCSRVRGIDTAIIGLVSQ